MISKPGLTKFQNRRTNLRDCFAKALVDLLRWSSIVMNMMCIPVGLPPRRALVVLHIMARWAIGLEVMGAEFPGSSPGSSYAFFRFVGRKTFLGITCRARLWPQILEALELGLTPRKCRRREICYHSRGGKENIY